MSDEVTHEHPILLVEDNPDDVLITQRALSKGQVLNKLFVVGNGEEALEFLKKEGKYLGAPTPSLVLLDLEMPRLNGFEVLKAVKSCENLKSIPIVVLTTSGRDVDIERAYALGCNSYITKPVDFEKFIKTVSEIKNYWLVISKIPTK